MDSAALRNFLDLEAIASDDRDHSTDDGEKDSDRDFIDDEAPIARASGSGSRIQKHTSWNALQNGEDLDLDGFFDRIYERSRSRRTVEDTTFPDDDFFSLRPGAEEFPLWRVRCRVGLEEEAVLYLLQIASSEHQIRSAFTCSSLRGYIYVEAILDANLISLLKLTPGIIRKSSGIVSQMIEPSDWLKLLTMKNPKTAVEARQWIRVRKGAYKGDFGFVTDVEVWGARVLVVPRLKTPTLEAAGSLKRKRTGFKPEPSLFDPIMFSSVFNCQPKVLGDGIYSSRGLIFEHQLQCISLDFDSMSLNFTGVPSKILALFKLSAHPSLTGSEFPRPEEWIFEEGERVTVCSSGKTATITAVELTHLLVDLATDEGIQAVSWYNVRKVFSTRDFVSVTSGALKGTMGWFLEIVDDIVTFQEYEEKGNINQDPKYHSLHVNWLKSTTVPFLHASSTLKANYSLPKADIVPWVGTQVIIAKVGNPFKGNIGVVKDVLCRQDTASGLKISLQLERLEPSSPFKTIVMDYDDVVERSTGSSLFYYAQPRSALFYPSEASMKSARRPLGPSPQAPMPDVSSSGGATPMPVQTSSLTPAWDPSSRTPRSVDPSYATPAWSPPEDQPLATSSQLASTPDMPEYPLLDERLVGALLKVVVNDGGDSYNDREVTVSIAKVEGVVGIRHFVYNIYKGLAPQWVSPKRPNPTRDNGILMVVQGDHSGKYVRRIHHRYLEVNGNKQALISLAVVEKGDGVPDTLTGEQFELGPDSLCVAVETNEEKKLNVNIMTSLRETARKRRTR